VASKRFFDKVRRKFRREKTCLTLKESGIVEYDVGIYAKFGTEAFGKGHGNAAVSGHDLTIAQENTEKDEILQLPEVIAQEQGVHLVVCIDEFQQIGEFNNSLVVQKRLRGVWQHQRNVSYCLFGSKKHLMMKLFQNRRMPFYQFGEMMFLDKIPTADWIAYICSRFKKQGCIGFFVKKGDRVTKRRCTGRLHPFSWVTRVTEG
jgi:hypothetical protein